MNYNMYKPDMSWIIMEILKIGVLSVVVGITFYDSVFGMLVCAPIWLYLWKYDLVKYKNNCQKILREEFKDTILQVSGNLNAGYSLENAFLQVIGDKNSSDSKYMSVELKRLAVGLSCNRRIEDMLMELGERCQLEEIKEIAGLIVIAKAYGGNIIHLIRQAAANLAERQSVELEINTMIAAKKLEGNIMVFMPFFIIIFMRVTNPSYMTVLYVGVLGRILMTVCLVLVAVAWIIANKIMEFS